MLLDLAGIRAGATGLREIRGHCVDNVLVRHGRYSGVQGGATALPTSVPVFTSCPSLEWLEELHERLAVHVVVLEGVEVVVAHRCGLRGIPPAYPQRISTVPRDLSLEPHGDIRPDKCTGCEKGKVRDVLRVADDAIGQQ